MIFTFVQRCGGVLFTALVLLQYKLCSRNQTSRKNTVNRNVAAEAASLYRKIGDGLYYRQVLEVPTEASQGKKSSVQDKTPNSNSISFINGVITESINDLSVIVEAERSDGSPADREFLLMYFTGDALVLKHKKHTDGGASMRELSVGGITWTISTDSTKSTIRTCINGDEEFFNFVIKSPKIAFTT